MARVSTKENKNIYFRSREERGLTREEASELLNGLTADRIEKIENERSLPHPDEVLMMAFMNEESLKISLEKKLCCFYSRSRKELWLKGETSGNYQHIGSITTDCDKDTLLIKVKPDGPACHLGTKSCFEYPVYDSDEEVCAQFW